MPTEVAIQFNLNDPRDYGLFLEVKALPRFRFVGRTALIPAEYADRLKIGHRVEPASMPYVPIDGLFDYQRDISSLSIRKRKFAVFLECVAGDTIVNGPDGNRRIDELAAEGKPVRVWAMDSRGETVAAWATAPWVNGYAPLYRVTLASGRTIDATSRHRVMTPDGWAFVDSLRIGSRLAVSALFLPRTTAEPALPVSCGDVPRCSRTAQDSTDRYSDDRRRCDGPLPRVPGTSPVSAPSPIDVPSPFHSPWRADDPGHGSAHSHLYQYVCPPSMLRSDSPVGSMPVAVRSHARSSPTISTTGNIHNARPNPSGTIRARRVPGSHPTAVQTSSAYPCEPCDSSWDTVVALHYIRDDLFYDIHVPGFENYLANGIWSHNCGYGKSLILLEFARHAAKLIPPDRCILIVSPLMVISQTLAEAAKFYGDSLAVEHVRAKDLQSWLDSGTAQIGITNYEALKDDLRPGRLAGLVADESSTLKSSYGKWGNTLIRLGKGLEWKLALTGTPAPNDRIEYANHAVFLDAFPTVNSFLARFFVNRGQTSERWEMKPHAIGPFYKALSHFSIFVTDPGTYGWKDNAGSLPPIHIHIHDVELTDEQRSLTSEHTGMLFANELGGITGRSKLGQIAKGRYKGKDVDTLKPDYIRRLVDSWSDRESTIVWCIYNNEQELMEKAFPDAVSLKGSTPYEKRAAMIDDFKAGRNRICISKAEVMGFGLNLQIATRHVFSGIHDSFENWHQCIKRSNRVGSKYDLNVHVPVTELERPMLDTVLRKARRIDEDTLEQERLFKDCAGEFLGF
jgi:hypothetical protein